MLLGWLDAVTSLLGTHGDESDRRCGLVPSLLHMDVTAAFHREDVIEVSEGKGEENRGDKVEVMLEVVSVAMEMVAVVVEVILVFDASLTYVESHLLVSDVEGNGRGN